MRIFTVTAARQKLASLLEQAAKYGEVLIRRRDSRVFVIPLQKRKGPPAGKKPGQYHLKGYLDNDSADGSIMIVVATDAPLSDRSLERLAKRGLAGLARTGASVPKDLMSPLFQSATEVTEEAIYNSLCMAETMI
jgi:L-aminopeptidase/D-esterase-like protein